MPETFFKPEHLKLWKRPGSYIGATWDDWYVFLGQNRDSGCLTRANFDAAWDAVQGFREVDIANPAEDEEDMASVQKVKENHWAVGWVEWIAIHRSNTAALEVADRIMGKLDGYPVVDEELWSRYEDEEATTVWRDCYQTKERIAYIRSHRSQFEFRDMADMLGCVRGNYFAGYASELVN